MLSSPSSLHPLALASVLFASETGQRKSDNALSNQSRWRRWDKQSRISRLSTASTTKPLPHPSPCPSVQMWTMPHFDPSFNLSVMASSRRQKLRCRATRKRSGLPCKQSVSLMNRATGLCHYHLEEVSFSEMRHGRASNPLTWPGNRVDRLGWMRCAGFLRATAGRRGGRQTPATSPSSTTGSRRPSPIHTATETTESLSRRPAGSCTAKVHPSRPASLGLRYGHPLGHLNQASPGVFPARVQHGLRRHWSRYHCPAAAATMTGGTTRASASLTGAAWTSTAPASTAVKATSSQPRLAAPRRGQRLRPCREGERSVAAPFAWQ